MSAKTIPGAELRKGYSINMSDLFRQGVTRCPGEQLTLNKSMGVVTDYVPPVAVLHSLLMLNKTGGRKRWVITAMAANDITIYFNHYQADNANKLQQIMKGAKHYWVADLTKGYWQVRLAKDSQWLFCFATPFGPYKYLRAPMGSKATAPYFDKCMTSILEGAGLLRKGVIMIHDDHAGYSDHIYDDDPEGRSHYHLLRRYLKLCAKLNVHISPKKSKVYLQNPDIAGHEHKEGGMRPSLSRYQSNIIEAPEPNTIADVYYGVSAMGWSRSFILNFSIMKRSLRAFVMKALNGGAQTMQRTGCSKITDGTTSCLKKAYERIRLALVHAIKRAYRDPDKILVLIWDSSNFAWSYTRAGRSSAKGRGKTWRSKCS